MIILGAALIIAGFSSPCRSLTTLGVILFMVGLTLTVLGSMDRAVDGRRHHY